VDRPARRIGSLATIVMVFSLLTVVTLTILLGSLLVTIGVLVSFVPAALVAMMIQRRHPH
jgi:hypothetical protein